MKLLFAEAVALLLVVAGLLTDIQLADGVGAAILSVTLAFRLASLVQRR